MKYSTETKLINAFFIGSIVAFAGVVILAGVGVVSYFMVG